ncbi:unnamed protein product [Phytomonas sp. Hart1]|nr:unnamed protein product [Phytomonas sp. Hart1]|eukprot:CCW70504.1 unnamed protein product [Phytomonas sp. isolate Hart1]
MFSRNLFRLKGSPSYGNWPWPAKLPFKEKWYHELIREESISSENRGFYLVGDILLTCVVTFAAYRLYYLGYHTDAYQTHLHHLNNYPPAIMANEFNFENPASNRKVERKDLDTYRKEVSKLKARGENLESIIFKF